MSLYALVNSPGLANFFKSKKYNTPIKSQNIEIPGHPERWVDQITDFRRLDTTPDAVIKRAQRLRIIAQTADDRQEQLLQMFYLADYLARMLMYGGGLFNLTSEAKKRALYDMEQAGIIPLGWGDAIYSVSQQQDFKPFGYELSLHESAMSAYRALHDPDMQLQNIYDQRGRVKQQVNPPSFGGSQSKSFSLRDMMSSQLLNGGKKSVAATGILKGAASQGSNSLGQVKLQQQPAQQSFSLIDDAPMPIASIKGTKGKINMLSFTPAQGQRQVEREKEREVIPKQEWVQQQWISEPIVRRVEDSLGEPSLPRPPKKRKKIKRGKKKGNGQPTQQMFQRGPTIGNRSLIDFVPDDYISGQPIPLSSGIQSGQQQDLLNSDFRPQDNEGRFIDLYNTNPIRPYSVADPYSQQRRQRLMGVVPTTGGTFKGNANMLHYFPQWNVGNSMKVAKRSENINKLVNKVQSITQPQNELFNKLHTLNGNLATWDNQLRRWTGTEVVKIEKQSQNLANRVIKNTQHSKELLQTQISESQIIQQVPAIIKQLVQSNDALSSVGFGKISENSSSLYAGRWIDTTTGRLRILPKASPKYINPASKQQKLGYLQARILNHWNELVSDYDSYKKLAQMADVTYQGKVANQIKSGLDLGLLLLKYSNTINRTIVSFQMDPSAPSMRNLILQSIPSNTLKDIFNMYPYTLDMSVILTRPQEEVIRRKAAQWESVMIDAAQALQAEIMSSADYSQQQKARLTIELNRTALMLTAGPGRSVGRTFKKLARIAVIPGQVTQDQLENMAETADDVKSKYDQALNQLTGDGVPLSTVKNLRATGNIMANLVRMGRKPSASMYQKVLNQFTSNSRRLNKPIVRQPTRSLKQLREGLQQPQKMIAQ